LDTISKIKNWKKDYVGSFLPYKFIGDIALEASILEMKNIRKQVVQIEFNDPIKNDTLNLEDTEIGNETRVDHEEQVKARSYSNPFDVGRNLFHRLGCQKSTNGISCRL